MTKIKTSYIYDDQTDTAELTELEEIKPYWKSMNEILEERAKDTEAYKELEKENKRLKTDIEIMTRKLNNAGQRYIKVIDEYEEKLKEIQKAWINFESTTTVYNNTLWEVDRLIMNR